MEKKLESLRKEKRVRVWDANGLADEITGATYGAT